MSWKWIKINKYNLSIFLFFVVCNLLSMIYYSDKNWKFYVPPNPSDMISFIEYVTHPFAGVILVLNMVILVPSMFIVLALSLNATNLLNQVFVGIIAFVNLVLGYWLLSCLIYILGIGIKKILKKNIG